MKYKNSSIRNIFYYTKKIQYFLIKTISKHDLKSQKYKIKPEMRSEKLKKFRLNA